jgi:hypothetical protein
MLTKITTEIVVDLFMSPNLLVSGVLRTNVAVNGLEQEHGKKYIVPI